MGEEFQSLPPLSSKCVIYKVPKRLRHVKEKAYTPKVVSIGPLHHGSEDLKSMEEHKMRYLGDFIRRTGETSEFFIDVVRKNEAKLRECYAETVDFTSEKFVKIILVDAAFILEVLLKSSNDKLQEENDRIFNKPWLIQDVWTDMLLLENQLPFFIIELLFNSYKREALPINSYGTPLTINNLTQVFFKSRMESPGIEERWEEISNGDVKIEHFVHLLRHVQLQPVELHSERKLETLTTPSIRQLDQAGVKFEVGPSRNPFDIEFDKAKGILKIPKLILSDETEFTIRNSLAFEQCHYEENYLNDYVIIMSRLVRSFKDINLLVDQRIVENRLNNNHEGSDLLNKLADGAILDQDKFYFAALSDQLNKYYNGSWHKWKANLKQKYFRTPWAIISVIAAIFLFILTIIQTVYSALQEQNGAVLLQKGFTYPKQNGTVLLKLLGKGGTSLVFRLLGRISLTGKIQTSANPQVHSSIGGTLVFCGTTGPVCEGDDRHDWLDDRSCA
ncbi:UPF0481 protein At3g47200-like [Corylus avellana]|uniref:UPF0481 protein At3g47200-like n=1 Tax=Corylus avellana TaxID=13451 RepID=UPI00286BCF28|nr:UPF0481 protein At3g47200-like [Corylus avellana]